jgi:hypothetical protein
MGALKVIGDWRTAPIWAGYAPANTVVPISMRARSHRPACQVRYPYPMVRYRIQFHVFPAGLST